MEIVKKANRGQIGTQDILPDEVYKRQFIEKKVMEISQLYGFKEMRVPAFEATEVFTGSVGESSDIVNKEMYTFTDKGDRSITLRPELTAGTVRAMIEHGLLNQLPQKISTIGNAFRYERPQAGRFREFNQINMEIYGPSEATADAELICLGQEILHSLGIKNVALKINSIGCDKCRPAYLEKLKDYFTEYKDDLDSSSLSRLEQNPMRILDSKVETTIELVKDAPKTIDFLCEDCANHFKEVTENLSDIGVEYEVDSLIVRGLDYYTRTVFEFISKDIGSQGSVGGGGRYDTLIERRGGKPTPAVGFGMGLERVLMVMESLGLPFDMPEPVDIFIVYTGDKAKKTALLLTTRLRKLGLSAQFDLMGRSVKAQMRFANRINSLYTLVIGEDEIEKGSGNLRQMSSGEETSVNLDSKDIVDAITKSEIKAANEEIINNNI